MRVEGMLSVSITITLCSKVIRQFADQEFERLGVYGITPVRGDGQAWDQSMRVEGMLSSCMGPLFGSAAGGAILPS